MAFAKGFTEQLDGAGGGCFVSGQGSEQGGFAGTVGAEDYPVLAGLNRPVDAIEDHRVAPFETEAADLKNGAKGHARLYRATDARPSERLLAGGLSDA